MLDSGLLFAGEGEAGSCLDRFTVGEFDGGWFLGFWDVGDVAVGEG